MENDGGLFEFFFFRTLFPALLAIGDQAGLRLEIPAVIRPTEVHIWK